jgi:hypothetical protein
MAKKVGISNRVIIFVLIIIFISSLIFRIYVQEGIGETIIQDPTSVTITMTDKTKYKTNETSSTFGDLVPRKPLPASVKVPEAPVSNDPPPPTPTAIPNGNFNISTQYDMSMTEITMNDPYVVNIIMVDKAIMTIVPMQGNTIISQTNSINADQDDELPYADVFPLNLTIKIEFDKTAPLYYLSQQTSTDKTVQNTIQNGELDIITSARGGLIIDSNYTQLGSVISDTVNPRLFTINITDSTGIDKININWTTVLP